MEDLMKIKDKNISAFFDKELTTEKLKKYTKYIENNKNADNKYKQYKKLSDVLKNIPQDSSLINYYSNTRKYLNKIFLPVIAGISVIFLLIFNFKTSSVNTDKSYKLAVRYYLESISTSPSVNNTYSNLYTLLNQEDTILTSYDFLEK